MLLSAAQRGDRDAAEQLLPLVYRELRNLARARMARLPSGHTLQPTALVHEVYLELLGGAAPRFEDRAHFFGIAARAMRDLLVEHYRKKRARKRGGDRARVDPEALDELPDGIATPAEDLIALDTALRCLEAENPRAAEVVHLSYFVGLTHQEIGELLGVTTRTVERDWRFARAWLHQALEGPPSAG